MNNIDTLKILIYGIALAIFGLFAIVVIDGVDLPVQQGTGHVQRVSFVPAHVYHSKSTYNIPDTWYMDVETDVGVGQVSFTHPPYTWESVGSEVTVDYTVSRLVDQFNIEGVRTK